jgi:hypothetical protein
VASTTQVPVPPMALIAPEEPLTVQLALDELSRL